jgi:hypothetical protein
VYKWGDKEMRDVVRTSSESSKEVICANGTGDAHGQEHKRKVLGNVRLAVDESLAM